MRYLYLTLMAAAFASCTAYVPQETLDAKPHILTDVPITTANASPGNVQVFFNGELPHEPYYKMKLIEVSASAYRSNAAFLDKLKEQAAREGMDGLLLDGLNENQVVRNAWRDGYDPLLQRHLTAVGIRFKRTIHVDKIVKQQSLKVWGAGVSAPVNCDLTFNLHGQCKLGSRLADSLFSIEIYPYAASEIAYGHQPGWAYMQSEEIPKTGAMRNSDLLGLNSHYKYNDKWQLSGIEVARPVDFTGTSGKKIKQVLTVQYDDKQQLIKKTLYRNNAVEWIEMMTYDDTGRLAATERYKMNGDQKQVLLQSTLSYYTAGDLPEAEPGR
ncbi:DUF2963 domain-containing protein [Deminuibacter soli]|nr:DUF2963 domain-containing protein [Deminuibacter soli]